MTDEEVIECFTRWIRELSKPQQAIMIGAVKAMRRLPDDAHQERADLTRALCQLLTLYRASGGRPARSGEWLFTDLQKGNDP